MICKCFSVSETRITTRLDEGLQVQILKGLYASWLERQLKLLEVGDSIEPPEKCIPGAMTASMSSRLRLLLDSVPLSRVPGSVLAAQEDQVLA